MSNAEESFNNIDSFFSQLFFEDKLYLELDFDISIVNLPILFSIKLNNSIILSNFYKSGSFNVNKILDLDQENNQLTLSMTGKKNATVLDNQNQIIQDTFIKFKKLYLNNYDILYDINLLKDKFIFKNFDTDSIQEPKLGFWNNGELILNFTLPFSLWYQNNSTIEIQESMKYRRSIQDDELYQKTVEIIKNLKI